MINYGKTRSTVQPAPLKIDEYRVWVSTNITPVTEFNEEYEFIGFEYDMVRYDKDEYIELMSNKNVLLEQQITDVQLALCEIYEGVM